MKRIAWAVGFALAALAVWGCFGLTRHAVELMDAYKDDALALKPVLQNGSQITGKINAASDAQAQSAAAIERDIRVEMWHLDRTLTTLDGTLSAYGGIPAHLNGVADASTGLLASAKKTTDVLPTAVAAFQDAATRLGGTADQATVDMDDFDGFLKDQAIHRAAEDLAGMADSGNAILFDFRKVADKTTADYLKPVRWYMQPVKKGSELIDIGAAIARHTP